jgi:Domain of unknown function (DUF6268)
MRSSHHLNAPRRWLFLVPALAFACVAHAGESSSKIVAPVSEPSNWVFSQEFTAGYSGVGLSRTDGQKLSEQSSNAQYVLTATYKDGPPLRLGFDWQDLAFSSTAGTRLPNTLQSESIIAGMDFQLSGSIFMRVEAQPGFYSASGRITGSSIDVPVVVGGTYLYSKDLQLVLGISIDPEREYPVLPGGGIRWQINDKWLLDAVLPKPRLEYQLTHDVTVYGGAAIADNSYRTEGNFGRFTHNPKLNSAWIDYDEVRLGGGTTVKISDQLNVEVEIGYLAYREFNYHRADIDPHSNSGGIYGGISIAAKF